MKRLLSTLLALCLLIALVPVLPVQAATGGREKALQNVEYYDTGTETFLDDWSTGVLVKIGGTNVVITNLRSRSEEGIRTTHTVENEENLYCGCDYLADWYELYMYQASSELGEDEGFTEVGTVTEGETVYVVLGWDSEGNKGGAEIKAVSFENGRITLSHQLPERDFPIPILNSKDQVCAVYYGTTCYTIVTEEEDFYGNSKPAETNPPATEPPATEPPATEPPATEPPAEEPPATEPPAEEPPAEEPPAEEPPAEEPPAEEPPANASSGDEDPEEFGRPVDLPELEKLYEKAIVKKKSSNTGIIVLAAVAVAVVLAAAGVAAAVVKNKKKTRENLNDAEEGTQLADEPVDTGLRLQFRSGRRVAVNKSFTVGRAPDCGVVISKDSASVSGRHCEIVIQSGYAYLRDLGSTNGTFINGRRVPTGQLVQLQPGMTVTLGGANSQEAFQVVFSSKM